MDSLQNQKNQINGIINVSETFLDFDSIIDEISALIDENIAFALETNSSCAERLFMLRDYLIIMISNIKTPKKSILLYDSLSLLKTILKNAKVRFLVVFIS